MRILAAASALALLTTASSAALARGKSRHPGSKQDPRLTWVDDEPMSPFIAPAGEGEGRGGSRQAVRAEANDHAAADTGTHRALELATPTSVEVTLPAGAPVDERGAGHDPMSTRSAQPVSGALEELAHRQMRKHQRSIDACTQVTKAQTGTITLKVVVGERVVAKAEISDDQVHDAALARCLVSAAQKWTFSLSHASFSWAVTVGQATKIASKIASR